MPKAVYESLDIKTLKETGMILQLTHRSYRCHLGIVEDVLVKVKDLVFPADFYVLVMDSGSTSDSTLIFGRPFLQTTSVNVSMNEGRITMEVGNGKIPFNIYKEKQPDEEYSLLGPQHLRTTSHDSEEDPNLTYLFRLIPKEPTPSIPKVDLKI